MANQPIEELELFQIYESVADWVWSVVDTWKPKAQDTMGKQVIRAIDSINANLVEGDARYTLPDSIHFFVIARGSARESRLWINRAIRRRLVSQSEGTQAISDIEAATKMLNQLINYRRSVKFVKEERLEYGSDF